MKTQNFFLFLFFLIITLITPNFILSLNPEKEPKKSSEAIEENDEFDDPSLLKEEQDEDSQKTKKNEKTKSNTESKKKPKESEKTNDNDDIYPSLEQLKKDEIEEMSKYKFFFLKYFYEICMISLLVIYIINAIMGVKINRKLAESWLEKNKKFFEDNYAHLGGEKEYNPNQITLIKDSYNDYRFFASGRVYLSWLLVDINLKRRQDLISILSEIFLFNERDKIMYEVSLTPTEDIPCIFAICKKKDIKANKKNYRELEEFTEVSNPYFMDKNYVMLTEDEDTTNKIFNNKELMNQYKNIEKFIDLIFFTDRRTAKDKHGLVISFELKGSYTEADFYDMNIFAHTLIDVLGSTSVKGAYKKEASARRKEYEAKISRELAEKNKEEVKNAKEEKKNQESNKPMTREQLRKKEEKERKNEIKERRKKMFKVVKA
jgi:flagellum-specific peptidoglycan hydrolase FlgJ